MKLLVELMPSFTIPKAVVPVTLLPESVALVSRVATSSTLLPFPDQPICANPSMSKSIEAEPTEQSASL